MTTSPVAPMSIMQRIKQEQLDLLKQRLADTPDTLKPRIAKAIDSLEASLASHKELELCGDSFQAELSDAGEAHSWKDLNDYFVAARKQGAASSAGSGPIGSSPTSTGTVGSELAGKVEKEQGACLDISDPESFIRSLRHAFRDRLQVSPLEGSLVNPEEYGITESRTFKKVKARQSAHYVDELIKQSWSLRPDSPGPVNPHTLALKALTMMRDLSPEYAYQLVLQLDALYHLETMSKPKSGESAGKRQLKR